MHLQFVDSTPVPRHEKTAPIQPGHVSCSNHLLG